MTLKTTKAPILLALSLGLGSLAGCSPRELPFGLGIGACASFMGRLSHEPDANLEEARERCGGNWDSFAFRVDDSTTSLVFDPLIRNQDLSRAMIGTNVELMIDGPIEVGDKSQGVTGRVTEDLQGDEFIITPLTKGQLYIKELWLDENDEIAYFLAEWDITFGEEEGEGTYVHLQGEDWLWLDYGLTQE